MTGPAPHGTAQQYQQAQVDEWSKYRARVAIDFYGTRAYNPGDPVPVSAVEGDAAWIDAAWCDTVGDGGQTFEGSQTVPPPGAPTIDPTTVGAPPASALPPPEPSTDGSTVTSSEG
jgi:hypothetical protein